MDDKYVNNIINFVNKICKETNCFECEPYILVDGCHYLQLKRIAQHRELTKNDVETLWGD